MMQVCESYFFGNVIIKYVAFILKTYPQVSGIKRHFTLSLRNSLPPTSPGWRRRTATIRMRDLDFLWLQGDHLDSRGES